MSQSSGRRTLNKIICSRLNEINPLHRFIEKSNSADTGS
jgi:hypothetical protein